MIVVFFGAKERTSYIADFYNATFPICGEDSLFFNTLDLLVDGRNVDGAATLASARSKLSAE